MMGTWHRGTTPWCRKSIPCMDPRPSRKWHESKMNAMLTPRVLRACTPKIVCLVCVEVDHRRYSRNSLSDEADVTCIWCYLIKTLYSDSTTQHNRHVPLDRYYLVIDKPGHLPHHLPPIQNHRQVPPIPTTRLPEGSPKPLEICGRGRRPIHCLQAHLAFRCVFGTHVQAVDTCVSAQDFHGLSRAS